MIHRVACVCVYVYVIDASERQRVQAECSEGAGAAAAEERVAGRRLEQKDMMRSAPLIKRMTIRSAAAAVAAAFCCDDNEYLILEASCFSYYFSALHLQHQSSAVLHQLPASMM